MSTELHSSFFFWVEVNLTFIIRVLLPAIKLKKLPEKITRPMDSLIFQRQFFLLNCQTTKFSLKCQVYFDKKKLSCNYK
jgi:hypothetical protein